MLSLFAQRGILGANTPLVVELVLRIELALRIGSDIDRIFCF
jgi:hypothetical protein